MAKHMQHLWEEAEGVAKIKLGTTSMNDLIKNTIKRLEYFYNHENLSDDEKNEHFGKLLFHLCHLTQECNIDSYATLRNIIDDFKMDILDPDLQG